MENIRIKEHGKENENKLSLQRKLLSKQELVDVMKQGSLTKKNKK